jgi:hypothetical protein
MNAIHFDSPLTDESRRQRLYEGDLFIFSPTQSSRALCEFARCLIEEEFCSHDPRTVQWQLSVEEYAGILSRLKPKFIHHPHSKQYIQGMLNELGCDPEKTYFDVPKMRSSTSDNYLTAGIAYAWPPHRDTWYSAPACQINWWLPIYEIGNNDGLAFHFRHWAQPVQNSSNQYNYYEWNKVHRGAAPQYLKVDPRPIPRPTENIDLEEQIRPVCPAAGIILFSAAQLHSTVPNTSGKTRFSMDFKSIHIDDVRAKRGAPNLDAACTGTSLRDFLRGDDLSHVPDEIVALYSDGTEERGDVMYKRP